MFVSCHHLSVSTWSAYLPRRIVRKPRTVSIESFSTLHVHVRSRILGGKKQRVLLLRRKRKNESCCFLLTHEKNILRRETLPCWASQEQNDAGEKQTHAGLRGRGMCVSMTCPTHRVSGYVTVKTFISYVEYVCTYKHTEGAEVCRIRGRPEFCHLPAAGSIGTSSPPAGSRATKHNNPNLFVCDVGAHLLP